MTCSVDVLVVDDRTVEADMTMLAVRLAAPGVRMLRLHDGEEALQYLFRVGTFARFSRQAPALVLLDAEMPVLSGPCVLDLMRAHPLTYDIPVVMLTSDSHARIRRHNDKFAADAYVVKPVDFERYCAVVEAVLNRWLPESLCLAALPDPWTIQRTEPRTDRRPARRAVSGAD